MMSVVNVMVENYLSLQIRLRLTLEYAVTYIILNNYSNNLDLQKQQFENKNKP